MVALAFFVRADTLLFMGVSHILSGARVRAEGLGDFGFEGRGGGRYLCGLGLAGTEFYVLLVLELDGGELSEE